MVNVIAITPFSPSLLYSYSRTVSAGTRGQTYNVKSLNQLSNFYNTIICILTETHMTLSITSDVYDDPLDWILSIKVLNFSSVSYCSWKNFFGFNTSRTLVFLVWMVCLPLHHGQSTETGSVVWMAIIAGGWPCDGSTQFYVVLEV